MLVDLKMWQYGNKNSYDLHNK